MRLPAVRVWCLALVTIGFGASTMAQTPTSITLAGSTPCGKDPIGTVNLSDAAPAGGLVITLGSSVPVSASVPASVTAPAGARSAKFTVTCVQITQSLAVSISATANGVTRTALLNLLAPVLAGISTQTHTGGASVDGRVTLLGPAAPGGVIVSLAASAAVASPPQFVTVPAGASSATFTVQTVSVGQPTPVTLFATAMGVTKNAGLTVMPPSPTFVGFPLGPGGHVTSDAVLGGKSKPAKVNLATVAPSGFAVRLASSNPAAAFVPATLDVTAGARTAAFTVTTFPVAQAVAATITASVGSASADCVLTVEPPILGSLSLDPATAVGGQSVQGRVSPTGAAPPGGYTVQVASSNPALALVKPSVTVPAGQSFATFPIVTSPLESPAAVTITVSANGVTKTAPLTLAPEGPSSLTVTPDQVVGGSSPTGRVNAILSPDSFLAGLSSSQPAVASVPASVSFLAGQTAKTFTITTTPVLRETRVTIEATSATKLQGIVGRPLGSVVKRSAVLTVSPPVPAAVTVSPSSVVGGTSADIIGRVTLNGPAPPGFAVVLEVRNPAVVGTNPPASLAFAAGERVATFAVTTARVTASTTVGIEARAGGVVRGADLTVRPAF